MAIGNILLLPLALFAVNSAFGGPGPIRVDIAKICSNAPIIIVGKVQSVKATGKKAKRTQRGREQMVGVWEAGIVCEATLKGIAPGDRIAVEFLGLQNAGEHPTRFIMSLQQLVPEERLVLFLKKNGNAFSLANDHRAAIRLVDCKAVTQVLASNTSRKPAPEAIGSLLATSLANIPEKSGLVYDLVEDLIAIGGKAAIPALKAAMRAMPENGASRGFCLAALLRTGDTTALPQAVKYLCAASTPESEQGRMALCAAMSFVEDAKAVSENFVPLMAHPDAFVRKGAAYALRQVKAKNATPQFIKGLKDKDQDVRYQCLMGLAALYGRDREWAPSKPLFRKNEMQYIRRWENWWSKFGKAEFEKRTP